MQEQISELFKSQGDYLLFTAAALIAVGVVHFLIWRFRPFMRFPWQLWLATLLVLLFGGMIVQRAGEIARDKIVALVSGMAPTYASELERMGHVHITEATPPDDPLYLQMIQAQIRWEKLNPYARDIYTFRKRADGTNILVVDSETDYDHNGDFKGTNEMRTPIGKVYLEPLKGLELAFEGDANFDSDVYHDEWGTWVSDFVPMRDANGKVEAVLGVDFDAKDWLATIAQARRTAMLGLALFLVLMLGSGTGIALQRANVYRRGDDMRRVRESEQRLRLTIRQMPLGFIELDIDGHVRRWNPAAERILGYTAEEANGRKMIPLIVAPSAARHVDDVWSNLLRNIGGGHSINENVTKDGRVILCEWFNAPLIGPNGKVIAVFTIFQDITERVNLEKQLQRSERLSAVGQLSAGVAHDFNNILTIITGYAGLLISGENVPAEFKGDLLHIEDAALRAASLTRQLLAFSRQQAMFPRTLVLNKVVQDIGAMLSRLISVAVKFKLDVARPVPPIEADPAMIEQVVTNLVLNARDAMENGGELTVSVAVAQVGKEALPASSNFQPGPFVRLTVRDTGAGIPAENISRIFEPFFTTKPTGKGTGLGLSVVHGIVQQHGGWITVESKPGQGSAFHVFFPPSGKPAPIENKTEAPEPFSPHITPQTGQTILLAEDEEHVRELACHILEGAGYIVLPAADGRQALEIWAKFHDQIDLLLTDMVMPNGVSGRELSERLLAERASLPVIYTSGYSIDMTAPGFCESDQMLFLPKPYQAQQLVDAVRRCFKPGKAA
jgi:PAS domain S-box-containing protein